MKLAKTHQDIIKILIGHYQSINQAIRGEEIAKVITGKRCAWTQRWLHTQVDEIPVYLNTRPCSVTLKEIRLKPPNNGILHVMGNIRDFRIEDRINIASKKFILTGKVVGRNDLDNSLLSSIEVMFFTV